MRVLLVLFLVIAACASPPLGTPVEVSTTPVASDSLRQLGVVAELLQEGDVLIDRQAPPYPDSALVDSLREVLRNRVSIFPLPQVEAFGIDSLGTEVSLPTLLREVAAEIVEDARAFVRFTIAWDGTVTRAEVVRVRGEVLAAPVRSAVHRIRFTAPRDEDVEAVLPDGVASFAWAEYTVPFTRSWLNQ